MMNKDSGNKTAHADKQRTAVFLIIAGILLCVVLALMVGYIFCKWMRVQNLDQIVEIGVLGGDETGTDTDSLEPVFRNGDVISILLLGCKAGENDAQILQQTEAMILCTIDKSSGTLTMTSFAENLWVYIPEYYSAQLSSPYMLGGFPLVNRSLEYNFGIAADYNIEIDASGFVEAIDTVGGVEIQLTALEADQLNRCSNLDGSADQKLKAGLNKLTGAQALAYSCIMQDGTVFERNDRQLSVIAALFEKISVLSATDLFELARKLTTYVRTDLTDRQILELIVELSPMLSDVEIVSQRIPVDGYYTFAHMRGEDVIVLDVSQLDISKKLLAQTAG